MGDRVNIKATFLTMGFESDPRHLARVKLNFRGECEIIQVILIVVIIILRRRLPRLTRIDFTYYINLGYLIWLTLLKKFGPWALSVLNYAIHAAYQ